MGLQKLQERSGSGVVTIPKEELRADGVLDDGEIPEGQTVDLEKLGERAFLVRIPKGGDVPSVEECDVVRRLAADIVLSREPNGLDQPAD
jgi:hypothetical protein